jgi:hypothetical protein
MLCFEKFISYNYKFDIEEYGFLNGNISHKVLLKKYQHKKLGKGLSLSTFKISIFSMLSKINLIKLIKSYKNFIRFYRFYQFNFKNNLL